MAIGAIALLRSPATAGSKAQINAAGTTEAVVSAGVGATIMPPESWQIANRNDVVRFTAPEGDLQVDIVAVPKARNAADAVAKAWRLAKPTFSYPLHLAQPQPARHGWNETVEFDYDTPPAEKNFAQAVAYRDAAGWTVVTLDGALATILKRGGQLTASTDTLHPAGYVEETFAGKKAHRMDAARIAAPKRFVQTSMTSLQIPGVGLSIIDHGRIVYEGGIGVKDVATKAPVDKNTLFMIASNTKGMVTLLLATLVDEGKLDWSKPVIDYMPAFRLGSDEITRKVLVKHLVCACTGLPRRDLETMFNGNPAAGADNVLTQLASTQPTSGFGEVYQYSNTMASAAGFVAAHVAYPRMNLVDAFDKAMQVRIFDPLGMHDTTFSNARAMAGGWARPHDINIDGRLAPVDIRHDDGVPMSGPPAARGRPRTTWRSMFAMRCSKGCCRAASASSRPITCSPAASTTSPSATRSGMAWGSRTMPVQRIRPAAWRQPLWLSKQLVRRAVSGSRHRGADQ